MKPFIFIAFEYMLCVSIYSAKLKIVAYISGKTRKKTKSSNKNRKPRPYVKEITHCQAFSTLCGGYFKVEANPLSEMIYYSLNLHIISLQLLVALKKQGKIQTADSAFDNEGVRYQHRFAPFNNLLTPPSMPYR